MDKAYEDREGWGSTIAIIIIVILLIVGGIYFYSSKSKEIKAEQAAAEKAQQEQELADAMNGIDADLTATVSNATLDLSEY
ncbi:MAG: hypothetical protein WCF94_03465 [bacterium]